MITAEPVLSAAGLERNAMHLVETGTWSTSEHPDLVPINLLHRGHDGTVPFMKRRGDRWEPIASVPASILPQVFPQFIAPYVDADGFYGINGMWPEHCIKGSATLPDGRTPHNRMKRAMWGTDKARYLTSCWADLDFHKIPGMTLGKAVGFVVDAQDHGIIPPATMLVDSGRGLWVFWLLHDDDNRSMPVRAWSETQGTFCRVQRQLLRRLASIEPDYGASDVARVTRVPGSINTKSDRRVRYWIQADEIGPFQYTLPELAALVGVRGMKLSKSIRRAVDPKLRERGQRGYAALHRQRLDRLIQLISIRGKIREGCRARAAVLLATMCCKCHVDHDEMAETIRRFGRFQCDPPLPESEIDDAIKAAAKYPAFTNAKIGDWLLITETEAELTGWPAKGQHNASTDAPNNRIAKRDTRHSLIRHLLKCRGGEVPTLREVEAYLDEHGAKATLATIKSDLVAMGIDNPRSWNLINTEADGVHVPLPFEAGD